ncbi:MAG: DUF4159 domain-containing protein [Candidatus Tectomicrobia bacterium]|nr:DUF4159 domain-containing protein [Candidatus Tectomicrobia bacterium]
MKRFPEPALGRRAFLRWTAGLAAGSVIGAPWRSWAQRAAPDEPAGALPPELAPGHIRYAGGRWQEYPTALSSMLDEVRKRTSIEPASEAQTVDLSSDQIFEHPFLYLSGRYEFEMPSAPEIERLRRHLTYGGFLLVDDGLGSNEDGFGRVVRSLIERLFPRQPLEPLSREHPVFRSYYLIRSVGGRQAVSQEIEGVQMGIFTPVVFCRNDLGGAWAVRPDGGWVEECTPGGEPQRRSAFQLGVNIALYAMTGNYKQDLIHHPFIQRRLNQS